MPALINDEVTELPVSRERKRQLRRLRQDLCIVGGCEEAPVTKNHCRKHADEKNKVQWLRHTFGSAYREVASRVQKPVLADIIMPSKARPQHYVYFLAWGGLVKIGCSSNPIRRIAQIKSRSGAGRIAMPEGFDSAQSIGLGVVRGDFKREREIKADLCDRRALGEWFYVDPYVQNYISNLGLQPIEITSK